MSSYTETRADVVEFFPQIKYGMPLAICDRSLAYHIGIHNKTLWYLISANSKLYTSFSIAKRGKSRSFRAIHDPDKRLKRVQRVFLARFLNKIPMSPHIGAYVLGRSCLDTAKQHVKSSVIVSMDIKDFFPSVRRATIRKCFKSYGYNHRVASLIAGLVTFRGSLPQGAPTSGAIANLVANWAFDQNIMRDLAAIDTGWRYTRYSDDIDVSHPEKRSREEVFEVINCVRVHVSRGGFRINDEKTKTESYWNRQTVLGVVVNTKPNIARFEYERVKAIIHNCLVDGFVAQTPRSGCASTGALISHLRGKLAYFQQIAPRKAAKLRQVFDVAQEIHRDETKDEVDFGTIGTV